MDAENFKVLRAQLLFPKKGKKPRSIMITSAFPGEGKTYVSSNLAASIAMGVNEHVLLVDCDFRKPRVHEVFGYSNHKGLHEVLAGEEDLRDLIIGTKIEKLSLLTAGKPTPRPSELLSSTEMKEFLEEVKGRYDDRYVIIDATPSQVTAEAAVLARYVDGVVFVVMAQKSPREAIQKSIELIGPEKVLGIVFNGYSESHKGYYKYYRKYYGKE
jgi:exopolysaccharide/PEP-CTERM locus tyrosine autokinase